MSTSRTSSTSAQYSSAYLPMNSHIRSGVSRNPVLPFEASIHSPRARSPSGLSGETIADDSLSVSLNLDDYIFLREMGSGAWGRVYHVVNKHTLHEYGLKLVSKEMMPISSHSFILDEQLVLRELKGLEGWAVTLHGSTHDSRYFYILMNFLPNGTLKDQIRGRERLTTEHVRFYTAVLALAIQKLQGHHGGPFLHRDIKPSNILMGADGYPTLSDFGLATKAVRQTNRFCGTIVHMAPEVHCKLEQGKPSEIWSLGTVVYTMACRRPPFGHKQLEEEAKFSIMHYPLQFPSDIDPEIKEFLKFILVKDLSKRPTIEQVLEHPFLQPIDRKALACRALPAPPFKAVRQLETSPSSIEIQRGIPYTGDNDPYPWFTFVRDHNLIPDHPKAEHNFHIASRPFAAARSRAVSSMRHMLVEHTVLIPHSELWGFDADYGDEKFEIASMRKKGMLQKMRRWFRCGARAGKRTEIGPVVRD